MKTNSGRELQSCISFSVYIISGAGIFSLLSDSENIIISLVTSLAVCAAILSLTVLISEKCGGSFEAVNGLGKALSLVFACGCVFAVLLLLTEVVKDTSFITNRGISLMYYTAISISVLLVCLYLSRGSEKGIFRFSILSSLPLILTFFALFMPIFTVKGVVPYINASGKSIYSPITKGIKAGLFLSSDSILYLLFFKDCLTRVKNKRKLLFCTLLLSYGYIFAASLIPYLIFGSTLAQSLDMPDYSTLRLIYGFDITELVSSVKIVSFLIKGSVYMALSARLITSSFKKLRHRKNPVLYTLHSLLPVIFLSLAIYERRLGYGELQRFIYPATVILSGIFMLYSLLFGKKKT